MREVRQAVGDDVELFVEGHGRFDLACAIELARAMELAADTIAELERELQGNGRGLIATCAQFAVHLRPVLRCFDVVLPLKTVPHPQ